MLYLAGRHYNDLVNQAGDGLGPMQRMCSNSSLFNPAFPKEDFQPAFRDAMARAEPDESSPFVSGAVVGQLIKVTMDLVRRNAEPVPEAMRSLAQQINDAIAATLRRDPDLQTRYQLLVSKNR